MNQHHVLCNARHNHGGCSCDDYAAPDRLPRLDPDDRARLLREGGPTLGLSDIPDPIVARLDRLLLRQLELDAKFTDLLRFVKWQFGVVDGLPVDPAIPDSRD